MRIDDNTTVDDISMLNHNHHSNINTDKSSVVFDSITMCKKDIHDTWRNNSFLSFMQIYDPVTYLGSRQGEAWGDLVTHHSIVEMQL